jgi:hypothetical protein
MDEVYAYLEKKEYPANATAAQKSSIRRRAKDFQIGEGALYYTHGGALRGNNIVVPRLRNHRVITLQTAHLMDEVYTYLSYNEYPVNATASQKKASGDEPKTSKGTLFYVRGGALRVEPI